MNEEDISKVREIESALGHIGYENLNGNNPSFPELCRPERYAIRMTRPDEYFDISIEKRGDDWLATIGTRLEPGTKKTPAGLFNTSIRELNGLASTSQKAKFLHQYICPDLRIHLEKPNSGELSNAVYKIATTFYEHLQKNKIMRRGYEQQKDLELKLG